MACLSLLHAGDLYQIWPEQAEICPFAVMLNTADAVLSASAEKNISSSERGRARADYIRRNLPMLDASEAVSS